MFTKQQLELLEDLVGTEQARINANLPTEILTVEQAKDLAGAIHSALWSLARSIPRKDAEAIKRAEAAGLVQIIGRNTSGIEEPKPVSRMKAQALDAKDGDELLAALGL